MRVPLLIAVTLTLAACGNNDQTDTNQNIDENLTAETIVSNDVTAIDAVTGDAANMAADVDMNFGNLERAGGNESNQAAPAKPAASKPDRAKAAPPPAESNTAAANAATNAE
jgi:hypothetical protein